jgi:hypothetical protein
MCLQVATALCQTNSMMQVTQALKDIECVVLMSNRVQVE